jgi:hypothetical protein
VIVSLQAYDECSAQMLENIADRIESKTSEGRPVSADSVAFLERTLASCREDKSRPLLSEQGATFVPLLRQIDLLTTRLADEIELEVDRHD